MSWVLDGVITICGSSRKRMFCCIVALVVFLLFFFITPFSNHNKLSYLVRRKQAIEGIYTLPSSLLYQSTQLSKSMMCVPNTTNGGATLTMATFYELSNCWNTKDASCRDSLQAFHRIYSVIKTHGEIVIDTKEFQHKVLRWLGNSEMLYKQAMSQSVTTVYNYYTHEETLFNPLRAKRPISKPLISDLDYIEDLHKKTKTGCDFCRYEKFTAHDVSGRLVGPLAAAAANTFRYDRMHQLIISRTHHPLHWSRDEFTAMFNLAHKWFEIAHSSEPTYKYPIIMWDLLPHGGASQVHPHLQLVLKSHRYPGNAESWRLAAQQYYRDHRKNYFVDLISVYDSLGLTVRYKSAVAIATLTPKKDNEVVIVCDTASHDFYTLLYFVLRTYIDDLKVYPFSLAVALPVMHQPDDFMPAFVRIVTRGKASEVRSDISSLELFAFNNVASDPFQLVEDIRESVKKRDDGLKKK